MSGALFEKHRDEKKNGWAEENENKLNNVVWKWRRCQQPKNGGGGVASLQTTFSTGYS